MNRRVSIILICSEDLRANKRTLDHVLRQTYDKTEILVAGEPAVIQALKQLYTAAQIQWIESARPVNSNEQKNLSLERASGAFICS